MMKEKFSIFFKQHYSAIIVSVLIGIIYVGPHLWFAATQADVNQGVPLMQVDNEDFYLARVQEVVDGHLLSGSSAHFEYKDQIPLQPPTIELLYALPTLLFGTSIVTTFTFSKFLLPLILFLLIYFLIYNLLGKENKPLNKFSAIAGALFIVLGYDLVNYSYVWKLLTGAAIPTRWLIFTRPINPISGSILFFSFLLSTWVAIKHTQALKSPKKPIILSGLFLGLMFSSYFFSWGISLSILAMLGFVHLLRRNYIIVKHTIYILIIGLVASAPYWYLSWQAKQSELYEASLLKNGVFYTHHPLLNKILIISFLIYLVFLFTKYFKKFKKPSLSNIDRCDIFILTFFLGGLFAINQQIITGMTIWPFHFVQFTIPLSIIAMIVVIHEGIIKRWKTLGVSLLALIVLASFWFGIFTQYKTYTGSLDKNIAVQSNRQVFDWFNQQEKDCVVMVNGDRKEFKQLSGMIVAFTHCNQYGNTWGYSLFPQERLKHSFLINLRFREIGADQLETYLKVNDSEIRSYLFSNWKGAYKLADNLFPDFTDEILAKRAQEFPDDYRKFLDKDLAGELNKYRLDFIASFGPLSEQIQEQLPNIEFQEEINGIYIYKY